MKMHLTMISLATVALASAAHADIVVGGSFTQNLDSAAFRSPSSLDPGFADFLATQAGVVVDPNAPLMIFGNHFSPAQTAGKNVLQFRPMPVDPALTPIGSPALPRVNYRDDAAAIEANIAAFGSTSALAFGVNAPDLTPSGLPGRDEKPSSFSFDPSNISTSATGTIGLDGATSFWYANVPVINTQSVWLGYGDLSLSFNAARAVNGNSGWFLTNNLLFGQELYDVRNLSFANVVAATETTPGSFVMSGDLRVAPEYSFNWGLRENLDVGSFTLNAITAVPEPTTLGLLGAAGLALVRRRRA